MKIILPTLLLIFCLLIPLAGAQAGDAPAGRISVHHEWGKLKEVVIGRGDSLIRPGYSEAVSFIYDPQYLAKMKKTGGIPASKIESELTKKVIAQIDNLAAVLTKLGVKVHRPRLLDKEQSRYLEYVQKGRMQLYARDPMLVIGNNIIETALKVPMRAKERFGLRPILHKRAVESGANYVAMPPVEPGFPENGIYIEGGDVLLNGYDIYVGNSTRASSKAGIQWLQKYLGPKYRVHEIKLDANWEHLDCVMALLKPGLGLLHKKGVKSKLPESLKGWDWIEVTEAEALKLGANALVLDDSTCIMDTQHQRIIAQVRKRGHKVIEVPYDAVATWGGAFRCSHHPLIRESVLK